MFKRKINLLVCKYMYVFFLDEDLILKNFIRHYGVMENGSSCKIIYLNISNVKKNLYILVHSKLF